MNNLKIIDEMAFMEKQIIIYGTPENPLFKAKDVAEWIEHSKSDVMIKSIDEDEKVKVNNVYVDGRTGGNGVWFLTEDGLYEVLMQSRKPIAKQFKKEVKSILKTLRKHGAYMTDNTIEKALTDPDFLIQLATNIKEEKTKRIQAEQQVQQMQPAYNFAKQVAKSQNTMLVREVAKLASKQGITIGEKRLYKKLREWGLILKKGTEPDQRYINRGYFEIAQGTKETSKGIITHRTTMVTGKGQAYIINRLLKEIA